MGYGLCGLFKSQIIQIEATYNLYFITRATGYFQGFPIRFSVLKSLNWYKYGLYFSKQMKIKILWRNSVYVFKHFWAKIWVRFLCCYCKFLTEWSLLSITVYWFVWPLSEKNYIFGLAHIQVYILLDIYILLL